MIEAQTEKVNFWDQTPETLAQELSKICVPVPAAQIKMRVAQIWRGFYVDGAQDFSSITTLSKDIRCHLDAHFSCQRLEIIKVQTSKDGTKKWLLAVKGKGSIEVVFIPELRSGRGTLCLSSQVGCTLTCRFCHTGTQRWRANLTQGEVIGQVLTAFDGLDAWQQEIRPVTNIVFMGQGEPLFNLDATIGAIKTLSHSDGLAFSRRKITVSTAGVVPAIRQLAEAVNVRLAVSLHATDDEKRTALVPLNNKYNLASLLEAVRDYARLIKDKPITFEYVMLDGINDQDEDARQLIKLIRGIPSKINLIPFNGWEGAPYRSTSPARIERFAKIITNAGYVAPVRRARGLDIMAACGQLRTEGL